MHYAAFASSSFLSGRPTSSPTRVAVGAFIRAITTASSKAGTDRANCCCRKGKCRELPELSWDENDVSLLPRTFRRSFGPKATHFQLHGLLRHLRRVYVTTGAQTDVFRTSPSYTMFRRTVASAASIPRRQAANFSSRQVESQDTRLSNTRDKDVGYGHASLREVFDVLTDEEKLRVLDTHELFGLGRKVLRETDRHREVIKDPVEWGDRLERLVHELKGRSAFRLSMDAVLLECLGIVAQALRGDCDDSATAFAIFLHSERATVENTHSIMDTFKHILLSLLRNTSPRRAAEFYLDNYMVIKQLLMDRRPQVRNFPSQYTHFLAELSAIFRAIDSPASFLASIKDQWDKERVMGLGVIMIRVLCQTGLPEVALEAYEELKRQGIPVLYFLEHALVRALTKAERFELANILYLELEPKSLIDDLVRSYDSTGLYLFAHQGDVERSEACFERLSNRDVRPHDINLIMHASAERGDTKRVVELFNEFFGSREGSRRANSFHYSTVINAHSVRDDVDGMSYWLGRMLDDGCTPDTTTYNIVLKGVAQRDDLKSIEALLDQMRDAGVSPDVYSYTTIIKVLARRRDVLGAEAMFKRMTREGVPLDRVAVTTLMNAHVEAGSWRGVIRVFDYISGSQLKDLKLGIEVFNTLLKAYVLIGAPLDIVIGIFKKLEKTNIRPTNRTFALLIQSACAANRMDIASRLFVEMEELEKDWATDVEVTKEVLTIIMAAYLQQGNRTQARAIYEDMQRRGIQPTAYTYATILRSYSDGAFEQNVRIAQEFLGSLVSQPVDERAWVQPASGRESSLAFVYAPLLDAHTKKLDLEGAEQLFEEFMEHNEQPTIGILALLMDAYRRVGNIDGVNRVWPQILDLAVSRTEEVDKLLDTADVESKFYRSRRRGDLLCIPLSIYIDALSHAGQHIEIAHTWNRLRDSGFQFDAHNWNHLVIALVRAGQLLRAFEVVEKVILPYQLQSHSILRVRSKAESPLVFDNEKMRAEVEDEPFIAKIIRSGPKRASLIERLRRRFSGGGQKETEDLAHELHLLQQISPEWNVWRPHSVTLQVLARALERLDSGRLIRPTEPQTKAPVDEDNPDSKYDQEVEESDGELELENEPLSEEEAREARKILSKILTDYPQTVLKIDKWESELAQMASKQSKRRVRETRYQLRSMGRASG